MASKLISPGKRIMRELLDAAAGAHIIADYVPEDNGSLQVSVEATDAVIWVARVKLDLDWQTIEDALPHLTHEQVFFQYCRAIGVIENQHRDFTRLVGSLIRATRRVAA